MQLLAREKYINVDWNGMMPKYIGHIQVKADGHMAQLVPTAEGLVHFSRTERHVRTVPVRFEVETLVPTEEVRLFGEYVYGTQRAKSGSEGVYGSVVLYDVRDLRGVLARQRYEYRLGLLHEFCRSLRDQENELFSVVADYGSYHEAREYVESVDGEGLVFRAMGDVLCRQKRVAEDDYICTGFLPFKTGPRKGQGCGAIIGGKIDAHGNVVDVTTMGGIEDSMRAELLQNPERFVGRVFTATGKGTFTSGLLRHPAFSRWRDDKSADDCRLPE